MNITRPIVMEIDLKNFHHNMKSIREKIGENVTIMPVIKANAYGTYRYEGGWRNRTFRFTNVAKGINSYTSDAKRPDLRRLTANRNFAMIYDDPIADITKAGMFPHDKSPNVLYWDLSAIHKKPNPNFASVPPPLQWGWDDLFKGDYYDYQ